MRVKAMVQFLIAILRFISSSGMNTQAYAGAGQSRVVSRVVKMGKEAHQAFSDFITKS